MVRIVCIFSAGIFALVAFVPLACAGLPRGAMLSADEQDADEATGVTIARGHAEISIGTQRILGRADTIELRPRGNQIVFKGGARLSVGSLHYDGEAVTCTLDFFKCDTGAPVAASAAAEAAVPDPSAPGAQPVPPPSGIGSAAINPR